MLLVHHHKDRALVLLAEKRLVDDPYNVRNWQVKHLQVGHIEPASMGSTHLAEAGIPLADD
jgi:hypothetical protein